MSNKTTKYYIPSQELFPAWEQNIPSFGIKRHYGSSLTTLRLVISLLLLMFRKAFGNPSLTLRYIFGISSVELESFKQDDSKTIARRKQDGSKTILRPVQEPAPRFSMRVLRYAAIMLLLAFGVSGVKAQETPDYSGIYFIASNGNAYQAGTTTNLTYTYNSATPETNFYLRPAADPQLTDDETDAFFDGTTQTKPFLTSNNTGHTDIALWILEKTNISYTITTPSSGVDYYYTIRHIETGKYLVCDPYFTGTLGENNNSRRKAMHLETKDWTTTIPDKALFKIRYTLDEKNSGTDTFDSYCFIPKRVENKDYKYLNLADRNQPVNYGTKAGLYYGGLAGLYTLEKGIVDINSRFKFEPYVVAQPTITFNNATNEVTITSNVTGAKIYYTTNDDTPTSALTAHTSPITFTQTTPCTIKAIAVKSWSSGVKVSSNEATYNLPKVATPTITINSDNSVTITCSTADATIYYKLGGDAPTIADGIQSSTIASILPSQGPIKAIAVKEGTLNSSVAEESAIPSKTIAVNSTNASLTSTDPIVYNGMAQQPAFTVKDGEVTIDPSEYSAAFSNNTNAGTATITITDIADGDYDVSGSFTFSIVQKSVTVTSGITASDKAYDGTTDATLDGSTAVIEGKIGSDELTVVSGTGTFADKNVGTDKTVNINSFTFGGAKAGNYQMAASGHQATALASITPATLSVTAEAKSKTFGDADPEFTYTSDGLIGTDAISGSLSRAEGENVGTYAISQGTLTAGSNYAIAYTSANLMISPKSIGDGNQPADGITIELNSEGVLSAVKDGEITLTEETDYTQTTETDGDNQIVTVTGKGNYKDSAKALYAKPTFTKPTGSSQAAAVYKASRDLANPSGIKPYIVRKVNPTIGTMTITPLDYIPEDVPVLLLSDAEATGFVAAPKEESTPTVSDGTKNSNQLKVAPTGGVEVKAAQVYTFYNGEFVLTKAGTLSAGKFYLSNPNFSATSASTTPAQSRGILQFVIEDDVTGIDEINLPPGGSQPPVWRGASGYTLDGRRLSGKPTKSGIYILKGQKIYIKSK